MTPVPARLWLPVFVTSALLITPGCSSSPEASKARSATTSEPTAIIEEHPEVEEVLEEHEEIEEVYEEPLKEEPTEPKEVAVGNRGGQAGSKFGGRRSVKLKPKSSELPNAVQTALKWLATHQDANGRWNADGFMKHDLDGEDSDGIGTAVHDVGVTSLALLAFLGDGSTTHTGPYLAEVRKAVDWLLKQQDATTGLIGAKASHSYIYDHAIATYALVEAFGLSSEQKLANSAQLALDYLEHHRNPYAVWRYDARAGDNDTSVTGWCLHACIAAQSFGLKIGDNTKQLVISWLDSVTDAETGRVGYSTRGGVSARLAGNHAIKFPAERGETMTALGVLSRFYLGQSPETHPIMTKGLDLVAAKPPRWDPEDGSIDVCGWYFGTYAMYQAGGEHWLKWSESLGTEVMAHQRDDGRFTGSWDPIGVWGGEGGRVYSTAMLALTLQSYYRYSRLVR